MDLQRKEVMFPGLVGELSHWLDWGFRQVPKDLPPQGLGYCPVLLLLLLGLERALPFADRLPCSDLLLYSLQLRSLLCELRLDLASACCSLLIFLELLEPFYFS